MVRLSARDRPGVSSTRVRRNSWKGAMATTPTPDLTTLRRVPRDAQHGHGDVRCDRPSHARRGAQRPHALKRQSNGRERSSFEPMMATELEFFLFDKGSTPCATAATQTCNRLAASTPTTPFTSPQRGNGDARHRVLLYGAGVPVENSKGEADAGQEEINIHSTRSRRGATTSRTLAGDCP